MKTKILFLLMINQCYIFTSDTTYDDMRPDCDTKQPSDPFKPKSFFSLSEQKRRNNVLYKININLNRWINDHNDAQFKNPRNWFIQAPDRPSNPWKFISNTPSKEFAFSVLYIPEYPDDITLTLTYIDPKTKKQHTAQKNISIINLYSALQEIFKTIIDL